MMMIMVIGTAMNNFIFLIYIMYLKYIKNNIPLFSIFLFLITFIIIYLIQPNIVFDKNGNTRDFGLGWKNKTILPLWLITIILAILSYFVILNIIYMPKFTV